MLPFKCILIVLNILITTPYLLMYFCDCCQSQKKKKINKARALVIFIKLCYNFHMHNAMENNPTCSGN